MFSEQLRLLTKIFRKTFYFAVFLFIFILIIELIRMIQTLVSIHVYLAWTVGLIVTGSFLWGLWKIAVLIKTFPSAPRPPVLPPDKTREDIDYLGEYIRYLVSVSEQFCSNPNLSAETAGKQQALMKDYSYFPDPATAESLKQKIMDIEDELIRPALAELDVLAERAVKNTVRDTMIGVMLLPFKAADIYLVVYRNGIMFFDLIRIYHSRPTLSQTYHIFRDVLKMVATVNILSYTERFTQRLMANVPILDKTADDIIQGTGAGVMTTAVGKATIQRCRTFRQWKITEQLPAYKTVTRDFFVYVRHILSEDVLPHLSTPWKQPWGYIKGLFTKSDPEEVEAGISSGSRWKFWRKTPQTDAHIS